MITEALLDLLVNRIAPEEDVILQFKGFVSSRPCRFYLTDKRLIRICKRPGYPQAGRTELNSIQVIKHENHGDLSKLVLRCDRGKIAIVTYEPFIKIILKKIPAEAP